MTRVLEFIIALAIVIALFIGVGAVLPSHRVFTHSVETNRPMAVVYDLLNSFTRFKDWNPLRQHDPLAVYNISGPKSGVGARLDYRSRLTAIGDGSWQLVESEPGQGVKFDLVNESRGKSKTMLLRLKKVKRNVEITQRYDVDYGWNLMGRYSGLYVSRNVGDDVKRGLNNFTNLLATIPRFDYSMLDTEIKIAEIPPQNVLYVPTNSPRSTEGIILAVDNNWKWIKQVMDKNGLEAAGPLRLVTTEYGAENYAFDLMQPVRKKGTGPKSEEDDADEDKADEEKQDDEAKDDEAKDEKEGEEGADEEAESDEPKVVTLPDEYAALPATAPPLPLEVKIEGDNNPVKFGQSYTGRAVYTTFYGHPAGLSAIRDQLRAWALVHGEEPTDRPFDEYLKGPTDSFAADAEFIVYWPLKLPGDPAAAATPGSPTAPQAPTVPTTTPAPVQPPPPPAQPPAQTPPTTPEQPPAQTPPTTPEQ